VARRILLVTRNFPPMVGGIERYLHRFAVVAARRGALAICGPAGAERFAPAGTALRTAEPRPIAAFLARAAAAAASQARAFHPDLVVAGNGLVAPVAWIAARLAGARFATCVYGLDLVVDHALYRHAWLPFVRRSDRVLTISSASRDAAIACGVPPDRLSILHPGVDTSKRSTGGEAFRTRHAIGARPMLLSVGRINRRKGLRPFVERALARVVEAAPDALFVIVGADADDAAGGTNERIADVLSCARSRGLGDHVRALGRLDDADVLDAYAASDAFVFPVVHVPGDMEGFGMVAIEAAAQGVPTVAFRIGGIPDAIEVGTSGSLVEPGEYERFADEIVSWLRAPDRDAVAASCRAHATRFDWTSFDARLDEWLDLALEHRFGR
jgi:phosphatidylinositol alpha-1,6-mannosyltransferase